MNMDFEDLILLKLPDNVKNAYNTSGIFASDKTTRGVARQRVSEGALLFKYAKKKKDSIIVEVGTKYGGSAIIIAAALENGKLYTIDKDVTEYARKNALLFPEKITLIHSESRKVVWDQPIGLLHIDGMNTLEAVREDFSLFSEFVERGGYLVMHNIEVNKKKILDGFIKKLCNADWTYVEDADESVVLFKIQ